MKGSIKLQIISRQIIWMNTESLCLCEWDPTKHCDSLKQIFLGHNDVWINDVCSIFLLNLGESEDHWTALHHTALHILLNYTALHCTLPHFAELCWTLLHCTALHCTELKLTALHCTELHCTALNCTALDFTALHCNKLNHTVVQCTTLHCYALYPLH